jgi:hypothetical protein
MLPQEPSIAHLAAELVLPQNRMMRSGRNMRDEDVSDRNIENDGICRDKTSMS